MAICTGTWVKKPTPTVNVTVTSTDANAQYGMVVVFVPLDAAEAFRPSLQFNKQQLANGKATWVVPAFTRCGFSLTCDRSSALATSITINSTPVFKSACSATPAGLAGRWNVTATR